MKYSRFREIVANLINDHYRIDVSELEMEVIESKLIEYAAKDNYDIYITVACGTWNEDFRMTSEDLLRFVRKPRALVRIEKLFLYTTANDALSDYYYKRVEPDEYGIIHKCPKVSKGFLISSELFRIKEEDLSLLKEAIDSGNLDLSVKKGKEKAEENIIEIDKDN